MSVQSLAREVETAGGRLAVVYIPSAMEVTPQAWEATQIRYGTDAGELDAAAVARRVQHICTRLGLPFLDLTPSFAARHRPYRPLYFRTDSHWNGRGISLAAEQVVKLVAEQALLPECVGPQPD